VAPVAAVGLAVPSSMMGGTTASGSVTLCTPAPAGGVTVTLSATHGATVPASVPMGAGAQSATFSIGAASTRSDTVATVVASTPQSSASMNIGIEFNLCQSPKKMCDCGDGRRSFVCNANQCISMCGSGSN
jgi:hypothetical protein